MTNKKVENLIIGFGKAGKTLANVLGNKGERTVLVEKSPLMNTIKKPLYRRKH